MNDLQSAHFLLQLLHLTTQLSNSSTASGKRNDCQPRETSGKLGNLGSEDLAGGLWHGRCSGQENELFRLPKPELRKYTGMRLVIKRPLCALCHKTQDLVTASVRCSQMVRDEPSLGLHKPEEAAPPCHLPAPFTAFLVTRTPYGSSHCQCWLCWHWCRPRASCCFHGVSVLSCSSSGSRMLLCLLWSSPLLCCRMCLHWSCAAQQVTVHGHV